MRRASLFIFSFKHNDEIKETMVNDEYEIILVNDASSDNTFDVIRELW